MNFPLFPPGGWHLLNQAETGCAYERVAYLPAVQLTAAIRTCLVAMTKVTTKM